MQDTYTIARIRRKYQRLVPEMDERRRGQWAAAEARDLGWGGGRWWPSPGTVSPTITTGLRNWIDRSRQRRPRRHESGGRAAVGQR